MKRKIILTADGSSSIYLPEWDEQYHSKHGAIQEAQHVFLRQGWEYLQHQKEKNKQIKILELGFGTGLNAFLTYLKAEREKVKTEFTSLEAFPLPLSEVKKLNYTSFVSEKAHAEIYHKLHALSWEKNHQISAYFNLLKLEKKFQDITDREKYDLIYFDAFNPRVQPELWTVEIFKKMHNALNKGGVLTTYCAKGNVRRAMQEVGFLVERLPGPPGKREMLRASKKTCES